MRRRRRGGDDVLTQRNSHSPQPGSVEVGHRSSPLGPLCGPCSTSGAAASVLPEANAALHGGQEPAHAFRHRHRPGWPFLCCPGRTMLSVVTGAQGSEENEERRLPAHRLAEWWWLLLLLLLLRSGITAAVYCSRFGGEQPIGHSPAERGTDGVTDGPLAGKSRVGG